MNTLQTTDDVVETLGGTKELAKALGVGITAVINWRTRKRFPADTYFAIRDELKARGRVAPEHLWRMRKMSKRG